jgi:hypothetical protein
MRRVVTGVNNQGKAVFTRDDKSPHFIKMGNFEMGETWADERAVISDGVSDQAEGTIGSVPALGASLLRYVVFPPAAEMQALMAGADDANTNNDQVSDDFNNEDDNPGMHTTETIDYGFVLEGSITLELDDGVKKVLHVGDCYIQNGTRHAWHNETDKRAVIGVVMLGANRA